MLTSTRLIGLLRRIFGLMTLAALGLQLSTHMSLGLSVVNYFSYLTNLANFFASVVLLVGGWQLLFDKPISRAFEFARGLGVVMMLLVGVVFNTLLLNVDLGSLAPWVNHLLHRVMPFVIVLDWLVRPPVHRIPLQWVGLWLILPGVYLVYSLVRGAMTSWYVYPFFDPEKSGGNMGVALYCLGMFVGLSCISFAVRWVGNNRAQAQSSS